LTGDLLNQTQPAAATAVAGPLVEAQGVGLTFPGGLVALEGLELAIGRGELVSIVGPSGCGKSTLLRLIAGLIAPTRGRLAVAGVPAAEARRRRLQIGFVFQEATLLPWRSVVDNIRLPLELLKIPRAEQERRIKASLELVGLAEYARLHPSQLSGGMRMRVALVRALATHPELLLLDEPFGALDEITRQRLNEELLDLWLRQGWTGLFVTHNVFEAVFLSQRILVFGARPGRVVAEVAVPLPFPRTPEVRATPEFARLAGEVSGWLRRGAG
jgi:NitT/TauT family transport system ATP-binding protein